MIVAPGLVRTHWHLWNTLLPDQYALRRRALRGHASGLTSPVW